jgi:predicted Zn-dependent protease
LKRRLKFIWGASGVIKGRWYLGLLGFYERVVGEPDSGLAISVRGLLLWFAGLCLAGYLAAATALLFWLDRNPYNQVAFADTVTLPWRWRQFQSLRGQSLIAEGRADMRAGHWSDALFKLRAGLAREPRDLQARLVLAQFYVASNQRPLARRTLSEGLGDSFPGQTYLSAVFTLAMQAEDYVFIESVCARYLPQLDAVSQSRSRRWLMQRRLQNFTDLGQPSRVLTVAERDSGVPASVWLELRVLALLALNREDDAVSELKAWRVRAPADTDQVLRLLVRVEREAKHYEAMEGALDELVARAPAQPTPYVYRVVQLTLAGRKANAESALDDYLRRFGARVENLRLLAEPLASIKEGSPALARIVTTAREQGFELSMFQLLLAQGMLTDGAAREAGVVLSGILKAGSVQSGKLTDPLGASPRQKAAELAMRDWLQTMADALLSPAPAAQTAFVEAFRKRPGNMATLRLIVTSLRASGRGETAQTILRMSEGPYPGNPWVQSQLAELASEARSVAENVVARPVEAEIGEKPFFAKLDEAIRAADWTRAQQRVRELRNRRPAPSWLATREADVLLSQIRIEHGAGDRLTMLITAKIYLDGDVRRSQAALALAQEFFAGGAKEDAQLLLKEILRKAPNFPPAERQQAAWAPQKK